MTKLFILACILTVSSFALAGQTQSTCNGMNPANLISLLTDQSTDLALLSDNIAPYLKSGNYTGACYLIGRDAHQTANALFFKVVQFENCSGNRNLATATANASEIANDFITASDLCLSHTNNSIGELHELIDNSRLQQLAQGVTAALYAELGVKAPPK